MIIKVIPETDAEKARIAEVEHTGIKEFFIFGSKRDNDGEIIDFHDWSGQYPNLLKNLLYFTDQIKEEQRGGGVKKSEIDLPAPMMVKYGENEGPIEIIKTELGDKPGVEPVAELGDKVEETPVLEFVAGSDKGITGANRAGDKFPTTETAEVEKDYSDCGDPDRQMVYDAEKPSEPIS